MKAILVIDMPDDMSIEDTKALRITLFNGLFTKDLSISQQLRPLPKRKEMFEGDRDKKEIMIGKVYYKGWNDCIDKITGETE